jgi:hypothetical protein
VSSSDRRLSNSASRFCLCRTRTLPKLPHGHELFSRSPGPGPSETDQRVKVEDVGNGASLASAMASRHLRPPMRPDDLFRRRAHLLDHSISAMADKKPSAQRKRKGSLTNSEVRSERSTTRSATPNYSPVASRGVVDPRRYDTEQKVRPA